MVEVNPLAEQNDHSDAADAKLGFDDNTAFRQKDIFAQRDHSQEDPRDVAAEKWVELHRPRWLDRVHGQRRWTGHGHDGHHPDARWLPANFLDVGGSAKKEQIVEAFKMGALPTERQGRPREHLRRDVSAT